MNIAETLSFIGNEVNRAKELHKGNFHNPHEALGVIREEYIEFESEVFKNRKNYDPLKAREEAIQLAAMCVRFITELS